MTLVLLSDRRAYREAKANCEVYGKSILPFRRWIAERIEDRAIAGQATYRTRAEDDALNDFYDGAY